MSDTSADPAPVGDEVLLRGLFGAGQAGPSGESWQVARRKGHLLVLARHGRSGLARGLQLYRALRPAGRLYRATLSGISESPAWRLLPSETFAATADGLVARLESHGRVEAMLFGNPVQEHRRVILQMTAPEGRRWVAKAGFTPAACVAVEREAAVLEAHGGQMAGVPRPVEVLRGDGDIALVMDEVAGIPLESLEEALAGAIELLGQWFQEGEPRALEDFEASGRLRAGWPGGFPERLAGLPLLPAFAHGDFALWNLLGSADGRVAAVDWEWAAADQLPGLDLVHLIVQERAMGLRRSGSDLVDGSLELLRRPSVAGFLGRCGWPGPELALACYASLLNPIFTGPKGPDLERLCRLAEA